jgi:hypothetical protein
LDAAAGLFGQLQFLQIVEAGLYLVDLASTLVHEVIEAPIDRFAKFVVLPDRQ